MRQTIAQKVEGQHGYGNSQCRENQLMRIVSHLLLSQGAIAPNW